MFGLDAKPVRKLLRNGETPEYDEAEAAQDKAEGLRQAMVKPTNNYRHLHKIRFGEMTTDAPLMRYIQV